ncbi:hypothetical protein ACFUTX_14120 [Microbacterium sp. NPDC057407]|uniref:hypothetical protein n=1 Tax=Microbacterium sp. NPDC057407 TaxID=3346120 RepID=UPI00367004DD
MTAGESSGAALTTTTTGSAPWLGRWIAVVTLGETVGFAAPALVGAAFSDSPALVPLLLGAGAVEGAVLATAQLVVLRRLLPSIRPWVWVAVTAAGAVAAYVIGMVPSTLAPVWSTWPWPARALMFVVLGAALLSTIGGAQWLELRRLVRGAGWWVGGTAAAWLVGLAIFLLVAMPLWHEGQSVAVAVAIGLGAGVLMALAMSTVTGLTLAALLRRQHV